MKKYEDMTKDEYSVVEYARNHLRRLEQSRLNGLLSGLDFAMSVMEYSAGVNNALIQIYGTSLSEYEMIINDIAEHTRNLFDA